MNFFGLNKEYRQIFRDEVYNLATKSDGGISLAEAWELPVPLRRYYLKKIVDEIERKNEVIEKQKGNLSMKDMLKKKPVIPDFITSAPAKK